MNTIVINVVISLERIRLSIDAIRKIEITKTPKTGFFIGKIPIAKNPANDPKKEILSKRPEY